MQPRDIFSFISVKPLGALLTSGLHEVAKFHRTFPSVLRTCSGAADQSFFPVEMLHHLVTRQSGLQSTARFSHLLFKSCHSTQSKVSDPLRILFCGSDEFSCESLKALHVEHERNVALIRSIDVVVRPPKPSGRGLKLLRQGIQHQANFFFFLDWLYAKLVMQSRCGSSQWNSTCPFMSETHSQAGMQVPPPAEPILYSHNADASTKR